MVVNSVSRKKSTDNPFARSQMDEPPGTFIKTLKAFQEMVGRLEMKNGHDRSDINSFT